MPGDSFMALWAREGVDASTVIAHRCAADRRCISSRTTTAGHHFLHYRANSAAAMYSAGRPAARRRSPAARMFYVSGISQGISATAADAVFAAIDIARRNGVQVAYDTNYRPRLWPPARAAAVMHAAMAQADYALPGIEDVRDPDRPHRSRRDAGLLSAPGAAGGGAEDGRGTAPGSPRPSGGCASRDTPCRRSTPPAPATRSAAASWRASWPATNPEQAARYANVAAALKCTATGRLRRSRMRPTLSPP